METRRSRLAADVAVHSDGGGKGPAAMKPITGIDDVMKLQAGLARVFAGQMSRIERYGLVNGLPGFISIEQAGILQTTALVIADGRIRGIYVVRNPNKLRHQSGRGA